MFNSLQNSDSLARRKAQKGEEAESRARLGGVLLGLLRKGAIRTKALLDSPRLYQDGDFIIWTCQVISPEYHSGMRGSVLHVLLSNDSERKDRFIPERAGKRRQREGGDYIRTPGTDLPKTAKQT